jgi:transposase
MVGISKIKIKESVEKLKKLLSEQKSLEKFRKIQILYLLKSQEAKTIKQAAIIVGKHRITVQKWLYNYQKGGLKELLTEKPKLGRNSSIPNSILIILAEKLQKSSDFTTYKEIQNWLEKTYNLKVSYNAVYYLVHDKLKISLSNHNQKK